MEHHFSQVDQPMSKFGNARLRYRRSFTHVHFSQVEQPMLKFGMRHDYWPCNARQLHCQHTASIPIGLCSLAWLKYTKAIFNINFFYFITTKACIIHQNDQQSLLNQVIIMVLFLHMTAVSQETLAKWIQQALELMLPAHLCPG